MVDNTKAIVEALLFATAKPLSLSRLIEVTQRKGEEIIEAISNLNAEYETTNRTFRIQSLADGYQLSTLPEYSEWVKILFRSEHRMSLSHQALEVLAIIAYKQPVTKPEIDQLRGVDSTGSLATLLERKLIRIEGRSNKPGHPYLYRTSKDFLRYFGLKSLTDLPKKEELEEFLKARDETKVTGDLGLVVSENTNSNI